MTSVPTGDYGSNERRLVGNLSRWKIEIDTAERRKVPADLLRQARLLDHRQCHRRHARR
jgi:hypothetical protein